MSIHQLLANLKRVNELSSEKDIDFTCRKIIREVNKVVKKSTGTANLSNQNKIDEAIIYLNQNGVTNLSRRQLKLVAWGLSKKFDFWNQEPIYSNEILFQEYIQYLSNNYSKFLNFSFLRTLIYSYFSLDTEEFKKYKLQISSLGQVIILYVNRFEINVHSNHYIELNYLKKFQRDLFDSLDFSNLVLFWEQAQDVTPDLIQITEKFLIPKTSWFFEYLFIEKVNYICELADIDFYRKIKGIVSKLQDFPMQHGIVLPKILKRYYESEYQNNCHEELKFSVLKHWGHPYIKGHNFWNKLDANIKSMVVSWIVQEELEAFFRVLQKTADVDQRRLDYWLRYLKKISYSEMLLGKNAVTSKVSRFVNFRVKFSGRFKKLIETTSLDNNAFLFKIGSYVIIEYSQTGNATYVYPESVLKLEQPYYEHSRLRSLHGQRLLHQRNWEDQFDRELANLGIFPD